MRRVLDFIYAGSGALAALFIAAIVAVVFLQVLLNLADKIYAAFFDKGIGLTIPSYSDFTGFFLAASTFLALAYTLRGGGHIRVTLVTGMLSERLAKPVSGLVILLGTCLSLYATWYMGLLVAESIEYGDRTSGMVSVPYWVPQAFVLLGLMVLSLAFIDEFVAFLRGRQPSYHGKGENLLGE